MQGILIGFDVIYLSGGRKALMNHQGCCHHD